MLTTSTEAGYDYYPCASSSQEDRHEKQCLELSRELFSPHLDNPDYLILQARASIFQSILSSELERLNRRMSNPSAQVLDVGGRLQPYRQLFDPERHNYTAIDLQLEGLADVVAAADRLPFRDATFDVCICAQTLTYVENPFAAIEDIRRILRPGGCLLLSAPSECPQFHDERWRILPDGLRSLLNRFDDVIIYPEVYSLAGCTRNLLKTLAQVRSKTMRRVFGTAVFPTFNIVAKKLDAKFFRSEFHTPNYTVFARK